MVYENVAVIDVGMLPEYQKKDRTILIILDITNTSIFI